MGSYDDMPLESSGAFQHRRPADMSKAEIILWSALTYFCFALVGHAKNTWARTADGSVTYVTDPMARSYSLSGILRKLEKLFLHEEFDDVIKTFSDLLPEEERRLTLEWRSARKTATAAIIAGLPAKKVSLCFDTLVHKEDKGPRLPPDALYDSLADEAMLEVVNDAPDVTPYDIADLISNGLDTLHAH